MFLKQTENARSTVNRAASVNFTSSTVLHLLPSASQMLDDNVPSHRIHTHTHTHPFNGPLSGTTRVSQYQKGKTNLDFTEARDSEWQWLQLGHIQVCTLLQTDTTPAPHRHTEYCD